MSADNRTADEAGTTWELVAALAWRTRREGLGSLLSPLAILAVVIGTTSVLPALAGGDLNGAGSLTGYARQVGASTNAAQVGSVLQFAPGELAMALSIGAGLIVRSLVGSEASRGALEMILASRYSPRTLVTSVLVFAGTLSSALWVAMGLLTLGWIAVVTAVYGASLHLSAAYLGLLLAVPLLTAWSGAALSVTLSMMAPRLVQPGQAGIAGSGGAAGSVSVIPGLVVLLVTAVGHSVGIGQLLLWTGLGALVLTVGSVAFVSARFRVEGILEAG
jgi:hypothetical protein